VLVYCPSIEQTAMVAEKLGCESYHSQQLGQARILGRFLSGVFQVVVATSALEMGLNIPDVRIVFHIGPLVPLCSLIEYAQQSGRAGRDEKPSKAIIIWPNSHHHYARQLKKPVRD
jgi:superfamily II DNA helicase RecQ